MSWRVAFVVCLLTLGLCSVTPLLRAQDPVAAALEAGEFGPALAAAGAIANPADRDQMLGKIAAAQAGAGAKSASLETASEISSDLARRAALNQLATQPTRGARGGG